MHGWPLCVALRADCGPALHVYERVVATDVACRTLLPDERSTHAPRDRRERSGPVAPPSGDVRFVVSCNL